MITQAQVRKETLEAMKTLLLAPNEGVMAVKFVLLTQKTLADGEAEAKIESAPQTFIMGDLDEIRATLLSWLDEALRAYKVKNAG